LAYAAISKQYNDNFTAALAFILKTTSFAPNHRPEKIRRMNPFEQGGDGLARGYRNV
jgi:hypothetical protein